MKRWAGHVSIATVSAAARRHETGMWIAAAILVPLVALF